MRGARTQDESVLREVPRERGTARRDCWVERHQQQLCPLLHEVEARNQLQAPAGQPHVVGSGAWSRMLRGTFQGAHDQILMPSVSLEGRMRGGSSARTSV